MFFVRLAACNVGRYETPEDPELRVLREVNPKHSICRTACGDAFLCDTNYHQSKKMTPEEIFQYFRLAWVSITGGEPFLYDLQPLIDAVPEAGIHIETSGTLKIPDAVGERCWITCSPKQGFLYENAVWVNEWKFLVGKNFRLEDADRIVNAGPEGIPVYLSAINSVGDSDGDHSRVIEILRQRPDWMLTCQWHKFLKMR